MRTIVNKKDEALDFIEKYKYPVKVQCTHCNSIHEINSANDLRVIEKAPYEICVNCSVCKFDFNTTCQLRTAQYARERMVSTLITGILIIVVLILCYVYG